MSTSELMMVNYGDDVFLCDDCLFLWGFAGDCDTLIESLDHGFKHDTHENPLERRAIMWLQTRSRQPASTCLPLQIEDWYAAVIAVGFAFLFWLCCGFLGWLICARLLFCFIVDYVGAVLLHADFR